MISEYCLKNHPDSHVMSIRMTSSYTCGDYCVLPIRKIRDKVFPEWKGKSFHGLEKGRSQAMVDKVLDYSRTHPYCDSCKHAVENKYCKDWGVNLAGE